MNTYWSQQEMRYITTDEPIKHKVKREESKVKSLYLPNEPFFYPRSRKYDNADILILSFLIGTIITMVSLAIIDAFTLIPVTGILISGVSTSSCLLVALVMGLIELIAYLKWYKIKFNRTKEWKEKCDALTLEWNRNTSLEFASEVKRK